MTIALDFSQATSPINALQQAQSLPDAAWWLPVCSEPATDIARAQVLGVDLVLWRAKGAWQAAPDQCPHRGARLSDGCVQANTLRCPYHGWAFDASGACTLVPAQPDFVPPASHGLACVAVRLYAGLLWVQLREDSAKPLPAALYPSHTAAQASTQTLKVLVGPYDVSSSAPRVVENFLDVSHFGTVHAGWLGDAAHMAVPPYEVKADAQQATASGVRVWQPKSQAQLSSGAWVDYTYRVAHPFCAELSKLPENSDAVEESIAVWCAPLSQNATRVWFSLCMADTGQGAQAVRDFQHTIFMQDKPILEGQRPARLPLAPTAERHSAADRMSAAYRNLLRAWGVQAGVILA